MESIDKIKKIFNDINQKGSFPYKALLKLIRLEGKDRLEALEYSDKLPKTLHNDYIIKLGRLTRMLGDKAMRRSVV